MVTFGVMLRVRVLHHHPSPCPTPFPPAQSRLIKSSLPLSFSPSLSYQPDSSTYCKPPGGGLSAGPGGQGEGSTGGRGGASGNDANSGPVGRLLEDAGGVVPLIADYLRRGRDGAACLSLTL